MPNKTIKDGVVKWPPKKKYNCKRNKGEHEFLSPLFKHKPQVRYLYKTKNGILDSGELQKEGKFIRAEISIFAETICKHCGKKYLSFLRDKLY